MNHQTEFDFPRGEQLRLLRRMRLKKQVNPKDGKGVSAHALASVLRAIDEQAGYRAGRVSECWASLNTIADCAHVSRRQVIRSIQVLTELSLITCDCKWQHSANAKRNHYRVVWSEVSLTVDRSASSAGPECHQYTRSDVKSTPDHSATCADHSATCADNSATCADNSATVAHNPRVSASNPPPSRPRLVAGDSEIQILLREVGVARWQSMADEFVGRDDDVRTAAAVWRANQSRIGAGAVIAFLRDGLWPVDGLRDPEADQRARVAAKLRRQKQAADDARDAAANAASAEQLRRLASLSDQQLQERLDAVGGVPKHLRRRPLRSPLVLDLLTGELV